ncbi:MAG: DegQ family serine endoprotease [Rhodospirillales bacterium]|nr:DegQ family serine endoprotease [Rhodospirillales bacterium]
MRTYPLPNRQIAGATTLATAVFTFIALMIFAATAHARSAPESFADLAERLLPSVVNISTTQTVEQGKGPEMPQLPPGSPFEDFFKDFFDRNGQQQRSRKATSLGSGFIISEDGYVVTNNHVIQDADEITVILSDDKRLKAKLVGRDSKTDLAVLKVESDEPLPAVKFGNSDKSRVGDWVVAIGNPFGLGGTVTAGIISARGRDINSGPYDDFLQTDASINRGNSGGPMFNLDGEVIGVNTAIYSPSGGSVGIGFAIPSATVEPVINQLRKSGQVKRGWLGVHIQQVTDEIVESLGLKTAEGALVASVIEDGPAAKSEIKAGDVILIFNGKQVEEMRMLPKIVADTEVDKAVKVEIWRGGKMITLDVKVGELEDEVKIASTGPARGDDDNKSESRVEDLGLTLSATTDGLRERFKLEKKSKGVIITKVDEDGPAAEKGIRVGDLIVEIGQEEVTNPKQISQKVAEAKKQGRKSVLLLLEGQTGLRFVAIRIEKS